MAQSRILTTLGSLLLLIGPCFSCPAGYESQASLASSARLILGVKVQSVADAEKPDPFTEKAEAGKPENGTQALVEVTETVRGHCDLKQFTLVGGPYQTCAPGLNYIKFEPGESLYLLLDRPLAKDTTQVIITWRCRVFKGTREELNELLARTNRQREDMLAIHRRLFPEAMDKATTLLQVNPGAQGVNAKTPYATLACLRLLLSDPARFRPSEFAYQDEPDEPDPDANPFSVGETLPRPPAGTYITCNSTTPWQHRALDEALKERAKSHPQEALEFNRRLFVKCLTEQLLTDEETATGIATEKLLEPLFAEVQEDADAFDLNLGQLDRDQEVLASPMARTVSFLLMIVDQADDRRVWRMFGFGFGEPPKLDTSLLLPLLKQRPATFTENFAGLRLLLSVPDPQIAPSVKELSLQAKQAYLLDDYFNYFLKLKDEPSCLNILERFDALTADKLATLNKPAEKQKLIDYTGWLVSRMVESIEDSEMDSATVRDRLEELARCYPRSEEE